MYKLISLLVCTVLMACGTSGSGSDSQPEPYVAAPLADLAAGTELHVRGNHTGWWRNRTNPVGNDTANLDGPKLQRFDTTGNPNEYVAVFRQNLTQTGSEDIPPFYYGKATFIMPPTGGEAIGTTDEGYNFRIVRNNDGLIFTLSGLFHIKTNPGPTAGREAHGGFVAGSYTPENALPTSGTVSYSGEFIGYSSSIQDVTGTFSMSASFGDVTGDVNGTITGLSGGLSDLTIVAVIDQVDGSYEGQVLGTGGDFPIGTVGKIDGGFYGPNGEETGATIRIDNAGQFLTGAFAGAQDP